MIAVTLACAGGNLKFLKIKKLNQRSSALKLSEVANDPEI